MNDPRFVSIGTRGWRGAPHLAVLLLLAAHSSAQNRKLNGPFDYVIGGDVLEAAVTVGDVVVYRADQERDTAYELYRVPLGGGPTVKLNGPLPEGAEVRDFRVAPDARRVVYRADQDTLNLPELYVVTLEDVPRRLRLHPPLVLFQAVQADYAFTPDSSAVVYRADPHQMGRFELFGVPADGGAVVPLSGPLAAGGEVTEFEISSDSSSVVYRADQDAPDVFEIFRVPVGGGPRVRLNAPLVPFANVTHFAITPDSSAVVYRADQQVRGRFELFAVPLAGGEAVRISGPLVAEGDVMPDFACAPDARTVVYRADQLRDQVVELFAVDLATGTVTRLSGSLVTGAGVSRFEIAPDASRVVYRAEQQAAGVHELFAVPVTGGFPVRMNGPLVPGGDVGLQFRITPDSRRVIYIADQDANEVHELFGAPLGHGGPTKLSGTMIVQGDVTPTQALSIAPDSTRVFYLADADVDQRSELFGVSVTGGQPVKLSGALAGNSGVQGDVLVSADSKRVLYRAAEEQGGVVELHSVLVDGSERRKLNPPLAPSESASDVQRFELTVAGDHCVYTADEEVGDMSELFSVSLLQGASPRMKLNPPLGAGGDVHHNFGITPDGSRVVYVAQQGPFTTRELFSVPLTGGPATLVNAPVPGADLFQWFSPVDPFVITPDSLHVVYRGAQETAGVHELFAAPVDGGPVTKLSGPLTATEQVYGNSSFLGVQVSPDSRRVVYLTERPPAQVVGLFSVPIEGGAVVRINGPLAPFSGLHPTKVRISADSARVVYLADEGLQDALELHSAPIGGGDRTTLNPPLVESGRVSAFEIEPGAARVLYLASQEHPQSQELYSVPIAGGPVTKLNGPLPPAGNVWGFALAAEGRAVFLATGQSSPVELRSVPVAGGPSTLLASTHVTDFTLDPTGRTVVFAVLEQDFSTHLYSVSALGGPIVDLKAPLSSAFRHVQVDSRWVVYLSQRDTARVDELYRVPIGGGDSTKLNDPLVLHGDVAPSLTRFYSDPFRIAADGRSVVYLADQDQDEVIELYQTFLPSKSAPRSGDRAPGPVTPLD